MEGTKLNVEKEKEQCLIDLKSVEKRLENEKAKGETLSITLNQRDLELLRCKEILTDANKQLKYKDTELHALKAERDRLKECLENYTNVNKIKATA